MDGDKLVWIFYLGRLPAALISAIPVVVVYCISNVMFLMILLKPIGEKLERIQIKHGIF